VNGSDDWQQLMGHALPEDRLWNVCAVFEKLA